MSDEAVKPSLSKQDLALRWRTTERSVDRWRELKKIPPPDFVLPNGWERWHESTISEHEKSSVAKAAAA